MTLVHSLAYGWDVGHENPPEGVCEPLEKSAFGEGQSLEAVSARKVDIFEDKVHAVLFELSNADRRF